MVFLEWLLSLVANYLIQPRLYASSYSYSLAQRPMSNWHLKNYCMRVQKSLTIKLPSSQALHVNFLGCKGHRGYLLRARKLAISMRYLEETWTALNKERFSPPLSYFRLKIMANL